MVFHGHTGLHLYPVPVFVLGKVHTLCHKTEELYICLAADHGKAAGAMGAGVLLGVAHEQLHVNGLARPAVGVVHNVHIPHAVIVVRNVNDLLVQVKGTDLTVVVVLAVAVIVLQIDVRTAVHHPQIPLPQGGLQLIGAAVEHQQIGVGDLLHHDLTHVFCVGLKGPRVHKGHDLIEHPVGRQHLPVQPLHGPHAVVLDQDLLGLVLLFPLLALGAGQGALLVHGNNSHVVQRLLLVFQFAFLAADEKRFILPGEAIL